MTTYTLSSVLTVPSFTEVVQKLTTIPAITHTARILASGAVLVVLYKLIRGRRKSKRYVNLTAVGQAGGAKEPAEYDIIIVGGGILSFLKCD